MARPVEPRDLLTDQRRYFRQLRWVRRRTRAARVARCLGSPRGVIAVLLAAALLSASVAMALGAIR